MIVGAVLALLAYGASEADVMLGAGASFAGLLGWFVATRWGAALPRWLTSIVMVGALVWTLARATHAEALASTFTGLLAALIVLKLWEQRRPREDGQLLTLNIFLTIGATLNDNGLLVGAILLAQTPVALAGVMLHHLRFPSFEAPSPLPRVRIGRAFVLLLLAMSVAGFAIAVGIFVFVPRGIGGDQLGRFGHVGLSRVSGLSDSIELGRAGLISQSQATVLEVSLRSADGSPIGGENEIQYLRAMTLDEYTDGRWTRTPAPGDVVDLDAGQRENMVWPPRRARIIEQQIRVRSMAPEASLPALLSPVWISWDQPGRLRVDQGTQELSRSGGAGPLTYTVGSWAGQPSSEPAPRAAGVGFPSERIQGLAREVLTRAQIEPDPAKRSVDDDPAAARALESHMRSRRLYTLDIQAPSGGVDPTEWFIFDAEAGHCEYFASALAALCRSVGIEARVATGYVASEWDADKRVYVVRRAHAHAWVEVHAGHGRWLTYDATPPADLAASHDAGRGLISRMARWLDSLESAWASGVVSFDQVAQGRLLGQRPGHAGPVERGLLWLRRSVLGGRSGRSTNTDDTGGGWVVQTISIVLGGAMIAGGLVLIFRRRTSVARARAQGVLLTEWLRLCARQGLVRPVWQPPLAFARVIEGTHPELGSIGRLVVEGTYDARFGGRAMSVDRVRTLRDRMRGLFSDARSGGAGALGR